ncbi:MAG TPA: hypothetical protein PKA00_04855 [Saprospiraceae bacterium]|nr:hypothetical protein [Saprospiraceae bacterium]HMQ82211.1 hypothetical protein [Saprospiraceae bacterium]
MSDQGVKKYSDEELQEFKDLIENKLQKAKEQLASLQEQIFEITENSSDEHGGDWMDDSSINNDVEMLNHMAIRQRKHIQDLENALIRIRNKTFGICVVTGELIDKKRLLAVPTTTKSLTAKTEEQIKNKEKDQAAPEKMDYVKTPPPAPAGPKIITKVIRKPSASNSTAKPKFEDDDDLEDLNFRDEFEDEIEDNVDIDLDEIPDEDYL